MNPEFLAKRTKAVSGLKDEKLCCVAGTGTTLSGSGILLEELAVLEHQKWCQWAQGVMDNEDISDATKKRWSGFMRPYEELPESIKEFSRKNARLTLEFFENFFKNSK